MVKIVQERKRGRWRIFIFLHISLKLVSMCVFVCKGNTRATFRICTFLHHEKHTNSTKPTSHSSIAFHHVCYSKKSMCVWLCLIAYAVVNAKKILPFLFVYYCSLFCAIHSFWQVHVQWTSFTYMCNGNNHTLTYSLTLSLLCFMYCAWWTNSLALYTVFVCVSVCVCDVRVTKNSCNFSKKQ